MSNCDLGTPPSVCIMCRLCSTDSFPPLDSSWSTEAKLCSRPLDSRPSSTSHMPNKGTNHICNQCLSNNQPLQRHLRPSRTSRSCSFLSQFDLCPLITKFAHRLNRMSFSNLLLTFFLYVILLSSQVTCDGIFELRLDEFVNELNRDASGRCCGLNSTIESLTDQRQICEQKCQTFFRVCFKNFQANIEANPKLDDCTFGQTLTPVLGESRISKHIIQFPFNYSWPGTFSLIIEAWNNVSAIAPAEHNKTPNLIGRFFEKRSNKLSVGNKWTHSTSGQNQTTLRFSYRFQCPDQYYGENCANKCTPKDDTWGHYNCGSNGERICHPGWTGDYCNQPICRHCNETNGACIAPGKCKCRMGWEGESCNQCSRHFGCLNGYCGKPWECICYEGWGGLLCNNDLNYCTNNRPCKNGGTCTNTGQGSFTCQCPPGFAGTQCEIVVTIEVDICDSFPCQNGATCKSHSSSNYTCECPLGYHGPNCEQLVNNCSNNPCDNGGTCVDGISGFLCSCKLGYSGKKCQTAQKNCETNPCHHGGICLSNSTQPEGYACQCRAGYKGDHCEININDCESNPCLNGGTCKDEVNTFRCFCVPGFHGDLCEVNVDDCLIKPCANGGLCHDRVNDYMCKCTLGYTGKDCSINIDDCASNPCLNGAYCRDLVNDFECLCAPNFYGPNCEYSNSTLPVSAGSSQEAIEENAFSPNQLVMIIVGSIALPLIAIITLVVFITCKQWKRHNHKMKTRRDEDEARRQNEHNSVMSSLNNKCLDQCLNPSAANVIVNAFDRAPSLHHLNKCLNLNQTKVTNEYVYGRQFDKLNTMQNEYRSMNKVLNTDLSVKLALDDPYSHTYEHIQKPSNLLSTNLSNQQIYQSHSGKQSNLDIYSSPAVTVPLVKSDCPQVMPSRPSDFGHHEQSAKVHSNLQNNIQIAATLQRMGCRSNSIYVIENHYSQPIYDDPKKLQATEV